MRPIDADELKKALKIKCNTKMCLDYNTSWCERCCQTNQIVDFIDDFPTVPLPDFKAGYRQAVLDGKTNYVREVDNETL